MGGDGRGLEVEGAERVGGWELGGEEPGGFVLGEAGAGGGRGGLAVAAEVEGGGEGGPGGGFGEGLAGKHDGDLIGVGLNEPGGGGALQGSGEDHAGVDDDAGGAGVEEGGGLGEPFGDADIARGDVEPLEGGGKGAGGPGGFRQLSRAGFALAIPAVEDEGVAGLGDDGTEDGAVEGGGGDEGEAADAVELGGGVLIGDGVGRVAVFDGVDFEAVALGFADGDFGVVEGEDVFGEDAFEVVAKDVGEFEAATEDDGFVGELAAEGGGEVDEGLAMREEFFGVEAVEVGQGGGAVEEETGEALFGSGLGLLGDDPGDPIGVEDIDHEVFPGGVVAADGEAEFGGFGAGLGAGGDGDGIEARVVGVAEGATGAEFGFGFSVEEDEVVGEKVGGRRSGGEIDVEPGIGALKGGGGGGLEDDEEGDKSEGFGEEPGETQRARKENHGEHLGYQIRECYYNSNSIYRINDFNRSLQKTYLGGLFGGMRRSGEGLGGGGGRGN